MRNMVKWFCLTIWGLITCCSSVLAQVDTVYFAVTMPQREQHKINVSMRFSATSRDYVDIRMPVWSPGYYQTLNYPEKVSDFAAQTAEGAALHWERLGQDGWRIFSGDVAEVTLRYTVLADRPFVATSYVDANRAFIKPAGVFMYIDGQLQRPARVSVTPPLPWPDIATGLDTVSGESAIFEAADFDILYDSPILIGELRALPPFEVGGAEHRFIGYGMSTDFDDAALMGDIRKIVREATTIIGEIPYAHYTFIGIGPGQGGIEQLNSTAISFTGEGLDGPGRLQTLSFIAHEYFHHYNVKRIRPIELGPFDYSRPNRTNLLWVAEGLTVYYENVLLHRAGLMTGQQVLDDWAAVIANLENNPGRFKQTLAASSWNTWEDGPFGKPGETISYYVKGPVIAMLLDIEIRHATANKRSLDDVMRKLYIDYYKDARRGFTEAEVQTVCEAIAGKPLDEIFDYIYTVKEIDYASYFAKAGLDVEFDTTQRKDGQPQLKVSIKPVANPDGPARRVRQGLLGQ